MVDVPLTLVRRALYGIYLCLCAVPFTVLVAVVISALPGLNRRRQAARFAARVLLRLLGIRLTVTGLERLPTGGCIVAANHASYLDGIVLTAALPPTFGFVIKREVTAVPLMHLLLRRLGSQFVDRFNNRTGSVDASRLIRSALAGQALGIFPEGTFIREPGLRAFRMGAFLAACRAGAPVVAVAIHGTRQVMPADAWLPAPGHVKVAVLEVFDPTGRTRESAEFLRDRVRTRILEALGEPDLDLAS